ncbi:MAG: ornithine carbamoyltransferase [Planctomycetes bacterium]|nr:ornithine carbamoyltransferase [Planctomycetota bacterium]NOG55968.1 ornithine carbamoyltransferase [Planctomycetota bacterium]
MAASSSSTSSSSSSSVAHGLAGRSIASVSDLSSEELIAVLDLADDLKKKQHEGQSHRLLPDKTLGMIFQKPSLRTRVSFESGMTQLGGHAIYLAPSDIKLGQRETTEDIAIVLSRMVDIIMARTFGHDIVEDLVKHADVPVINGLSEREHPCQILADLQTIRERQARMAGLRVVWSGDGNNVAHSLMYGAALTGMELFIVTPPGYEPLDEIVADSRALAVKTGASIHVTNDLQSACKGAHVIYTDVWASMGQEEEAAERKKTFAPYQVNMRLLENADPSCIILHCLPAHYGDEIDYESSRSPNSAIFDQAENRLHAQKALMVLLAGAG